MPAFTTPDELNANREINLLLEMHDENIRKLIAEKISEFDADTKASRNIKTQTYSFGNPEDCKSYMNSSLKGKLMGDLKNFEDADCRHENNSAITVTFHIPEGKNETKD